MNLSSKYSSYQDRNHNSYGYALETLIRRGRSTFFPHSKGWEESLDSHLRFRPLLSTPSSKLCVSGPQLVGGDPRVYGGLEDSFTGVAQDFQKTQIFTL